MFILVSILDDVPILPKNLGSDYKLELKRQIQAKYVDRLIPNVGLCIEFYEFGHIKEYATIYPGDGMASYNDSYFKAKNFGEPYFKVEFKLIVFQPSVDEWLVGSITGSDERGINVTLGFFQDVFIPASNLCLQNSPFVFDKPNQSHVWIWRNKETNEEPVPFFCDKDAVIRFRVVAIDFKEPTCPKARCCTPDCQREPWNGAHSEPCCRPCKASDGSEHSPDCQSKWQSRLRLSAMRVIGAVDRDGLGCVSWWPRSMFDNGSSEAEAPLMDGSMAEGTSNDVVMADEPVES